MDFIKLVEHTFLAPFIETSAGSTVTINTDIPLNAVLAPGWGFAIQAVVGQT